eukprot:g5632.t1
MAEKSPQGSGRISGLNTQAGLGLCDDSKPKGARSSASASSSSLSHKNIKSYLLLHNVGKKQNFGQLLRSAMAFGVSEVGVVGAKRIADLSLFGNQGTASHCDFRFFDSLADAKAHYQAHGPDGPDADICGVEIVAGSKPIMALSPTTGEVVHPFRRNRSTVFMLGNEGAGMSAQQKDVCDFFVHIPQYSRKTASLNVAVAGSIVLQHFALFAGFEAAPISGEKFEVEEARSKLDRFQNPTADEMEIIEKKRAERGAAKRARADESRDAEFFPSDLEEAARSRTGSGSAVGCRRDE